MNETPSITQAIVIPYRITSAGLPRFCMITSNKKREWIFPKGTVDPGEVPEQTALKEALEEAGLHGELDPEPLGNFKREKWGHEVQTYVFLMRVTQADDIWRESYKRRRRWRSPEKAIFKLGLGKPYLIPFLESAIERVELQLSESLQSLLLNE